MPAKMKSPPPPPPKIVGAEPKVPERLQKLGPEPPLPVLGHTAPIRLPLSRPRCYGGLHAHSAGPAMA